MSVTFVSHGAPTVAMAEDDYVQALRRHGATLKGARAIVVVSAHWETSKAAWLVTGAERPATVHDFGGFPRELYELQYPAPGQPELAAEVVALLGAGGLRSGLDLERGFDHGVWVPLRHMVPAANLPVVAVSMPRRRTPEDVVRMGRALAPLRDDGVALIGSGGVVHNLGLLAFDDAGAPVPDWAHDFDAWAVARARALDADALCQFRSHHEARLAVPSTEHYDPLLFAVGAARAGDTMTEIYRGFSFGSLAMTCLAFG